MAASRGILSILLIPQSFLLGAIFLMTFHLYLAHLHTLLLCLLRSWWAGLPRDVGSKWEGEGGILPVFR